MSGIKEFKSLKLPAALALLDPKVRPWRTPDRQNYADIQVGGRFVTVSLAMSQAEALMLEALRESLPGAVIQPSIADSLVRYFNAMANGTQAPVHEAKFRVQGVGGVLYYDLGGVQNEVIEFRGGTWKVTARPAGIKFVRGGGTLPVKPPSPDLPRGTLVDELRPFLHCSEADLHLIAGWMVGAFHPTGPYPIMLLNGEQGSAKSSVTRLLRQLVDPDTRDIREPPENTRDFVAAVRNGYVVAFDNMSYIKPSFSDTLCRIATGTGAIGGRALYTNHDDASFMACRPILVNGIPDVAEREDLADRAISISLPLIGVRKTDAEYWAAVEGARPRLLAALFDAVARAQERFQSVTPSVLPRMANFAQWIYAAYPTVEEGERFLQWYAANRREATVSTLETDPLLQGIVSLLREKGSYEGTMFDLMADLQLHVPQGFEGTFPKTPKGLAERLKRAAPVLRQLGINNHRGGREGGTGRRRLCLVWSREAEERGYQVTVA